MRSREIVYPRYILVFVALIAAALACNLEVGGDSETDTTPTPTIERPMVEILEPAEGATVLVQQPVSVQARAAGSSGVTLVELRVNNLVVDSQVPAEAINPTQLEVVLDYTPERAGRYTLSVTAYANNIAGQPALRTIEVVDELDPGDGGGTTGTQPAISPTPTQYNPLCRARVNVGLNFRTGPGTEYDRILTFSAGQEPPITGYADRPDGRWWQVSWGGQLGWLKESYTTQLGDCTAIRPAVVPPSPTPVPTETPQPTPVNATPTPGLPDLRLSVLDGPREVNLSGDLTARATYTLRVQNNGGQTSGQFRLAVGLPTGATEYYDVPGLNPGQEFQVPSGGLSVDFDSPGIKRLLVTVDDQNVVAESAEGNNQAYLDITVNAPPDQTEEATE